MLFIGGLRVVIGSWFLDIGSEYLTVSGFGFRLCHSFGINYFIEQNVAKYKNLWKILQKGKPVF